MNRSREFPISTAGRSSCSQPKERDRPTAAMLKAAALVLVLSAALAVSVMSRSAPAEEAYDLEDTVYATGAIFDTEEELADKPHTPLFRNHLPKFVDLSDRFPPVGNQGDQGSCTAWAVGYAARSYYPKSSSWVRAGLRKTLVDWEDERIERGPRGSPSG